MNTWTSLQFVCTKLLWASSHFVMNMICVSDFLSIEWEMSKDDFVYIVWAWFSCFKSTHIKTMVKLLWMVPCILGSSSEGFICPFMARLGKLVHCPVFFSFLLFLVALMHWAWLHVWWLSMIVFWFLALHMIPCFFYSYSIMTKYNYSLIISKIIMTWLLCILLWRNVSDIWDLTYGFSFRINVNNHSEWNKKCWENSVIS
jgi:hypothetical protein